MKVSLPQYSYYRHSHRTLNNFCFPPTKICNCQLIISKSLFMSLSATNIHNFSLKIHHEFCTLQLDKPHVHINLNQMQNSQKYALRYFRYDVKFYIKVVMIVIMLWVVSGRDFCGAAVHSNLNYVINTWWGDIISGIILDLNRVHGWSYVNNTMTWLWVYTGGCMHLCVTSHRSRHISFDTSHTGTVT